MKRSFLHAVSAICVVMALTGCDNVVAPDEPPDATPPALGALKVVTFTSDAGSASDTYQDYMIYVDKWPARHIGHNDVVTLSLPVGDYQISLNQLARGCAVIGDNPRLVTVGAARTTETGFQVSCEEVPQ